MLTPEQQAQLAQTEAELAGKAAPAAAIGELITQEDENATYRVILLPIVQTLSAVICPNWELTTDEHHQVVEAFVPLIKKYIPNIEDGASLPPEVLALLTVAMIAAPRVAKQQPMRIIVKEEKEAA